MFNVFTEKMIVRFPLILESQTTIGDVVKIFQPFEEGNSDTTSIDVQVWNDKNVSVDKNFVSSWSCWSICSFSDDLSLE